jgi:ketosteroid isomerase-like protein
MTTPHPAIAAHRNSIAYAMAGEKEKWLALFAADAVVHDPVGPSPHDPEGKGNRGHAELAAFWDTMIGPSNLLFIPHKRIVSGPNAAAVTMTAVNYIQGLKTFIEMIAVYTVDTAGKIASLNVYWDLAALTAQLPAPVQP